MFWNIGAPLNYDKLNELKIKHNLFIVEDAACTIGAVYKGVKVGNQADITVFSLHPRKFITTGEGGLIQPIIKNGLIGLTHINTLVWIWPVPIEKVYTLT